MAKFGRKYVLSVGTQNGGTITIKPPFTLQFDITRNVLTSANVASIRVYNLNANNRFQIRKNVNDYGSLRLIKLQAGYGSNLPTIFEGNISQAWSVREGTDFITQIESFDGGFAFANNMSDISPPAGITKQAVINELVQNLAGSGVALGAVGAVEGSLSRANAYSGNTTAILGELTGGRFYIDNGKAYVLGDDEYISGPVTLINAASGLLGTPVAEQTIINFDMLFEPKLIIGQLVTLESQTEKIFNGSYKVISLKHRGMISEAVCGDAVTSVGLLQPLGTQQLKQVGS